MCSIVTYRMEKDEMKHPLLVAEDSFEYMISEINDPEGAVALVNTIFRMNHLAEESVCMIAQDVKGGVLGLFKVSHGILDGTPCNPREIFLRALIAGAGAIIILHNHPSGDPDPSEQDIMVFEKLLKAGRLIGIGLNDFIIIGDTYYSFKEEGWEFR